MIIKLIEPLDVHQHALNRLLSPLQEQGHNTIVYDEPANSLEELIHRCTDAEVLIIANQPLPKEVVEASSNLNMISVAFTGIDHVGGVDVLKERGITVCNAAGYSNHSVAELVLGLTLNLLRNITAADTATRNGGTLQGLVGNELRGKTVGIIGTGRIGLQVAALYKAFGCRILGYNPSIKPEGLTLGVEYKGFDEVLSESDVVTLHLPLTQNTKEILSVEKIGLMKETALLINCARGPIVDHLALADALNNDELAGAGIDVFNLEPPLPQDYPLLQAKNTLFTPHYAFATKESMALRAKIAIDNVEAFLNGQPKNVML